jgi:hypothetical protein
MASTLIKCLCGACEVSVAAPSIEQFYCHCDDCRAVSVGAYASISLYPIDAVTLKDGPAATWVYKSMPRTFCKQCGTLLYGEVASLGIRGLNASLLPQSHFKPRFHQQCKFAELSFTDGLPHYAGTPAMWGGSEEKVAWSTKEKSQLVCH